MVLRRSLAAVAVLMLLPVYARAQGARRLDTPAIPQPAGDAPVLQPAHSALDSSGAGDSADHSALASPVPPLPAGDSLTLGATVRMTLSDALNSKTQRNGDKIRGTLAELLTTRSGRTLPRGARVEATVVSDAPVGVMSNYGVLSLQLTRVSGLPVVSDVVDFNGQEGHRDVADSAPQRGTEAMVAAGTELHFKVLENSEVPGLVTGVAPAKTAAPGAPAAPSGGAAIDGPQGTPSPSTGAGQKPVQNGAGDAPGKPR